MSGNMDISVSFRITKEQQEALLESAKDAGCHSVSEFARRKVFEDVSNGMRDTILLIKELALSSVAHHTLQFDIMGISAEVRKPLIDQCKIDLLEAWNAKKGSV